MALYGICEGVFSSLKWYKAHKESSMTHQGEVYCISGAIKISLKEVKYCQEGVYMVH